MQHSGGTRTDNIFSIPAGVSFADELARYLLERGQGQTIDLSRMLVLLPSRRACRTVREAFLRLSEGKPTILPRLQPLADIDADELSLAFTALSDETLDIPPAIAPLKRQIILARTVMALYEQTLPTEQRPRFDQALQLAGELANFLNQVQTERVSFDKLHELVPEEFAQHWQITLDFLKILTHNWPEILKGYNVIDPAERRNLLLQAQADLWRENPPDYPVIAAGTIASVPATLDLLEVISALPQGEIILPGLDQHIDEKTWDNLPADHPQFFLSQLLSRLGTVRSDVRSLKDTPALSARAHFWSEVMRPANTTGQWRQLSSSDITQTAVDPLKTLECKNGQEEAEAIALIIRQTLETPDKTVALIAPDRDLARRVTNSLKRWGIIVDDTAGKRLNQTEKGAWILAIADMVAKEFNPVSFLNALKNPLCHMGRTPHDLEAQLTQIEIKALRGVQPAAGIGGIRVRLEECESTHDLTPSLDLLNILEEVTSEITKTLKDAKPFREHILAHIQIIEDLATRENAAGADVVWAAEDGEALSLFFSEMLQISQDIPPLNFIQYTLVLRQLFTQKTVRPRYGTHPRISILGMIESRLFVADTIILSGLNEGHWPAETADDPWMSRQMRRSFGLPAREQSIGITAHDFVQLASADDVYLTRAAREGTSPTTPSRWLLRMNTVLDALQLKLPIQTSVNLLNWQKQLDKPAHVQPIKRPGPCPPTAARPMSLSVTGVERLMRDPYEVYAKYILKLRALDPLDADPAAAERGQILHKILENFVSAYPDQLPPAAEETLLDMGARIFDEENIPVEIRSFWWPRFERLAGQYISEEIAWRHNASPQATEIKASLDMNIDKITFTLTAIADRIDRLKTGSGAIIDYKTGSIPHEKDIEAGYSPQLWLEALLLKNGSFENIPPMPVDYIGFWVVSGGHGNDIQKPVKCSDHAAKIIETEDGLRRVLAKFYQEDTPYIAQPNSNAVPRYSDYTHMERSAEWMYDHNVDICKVGQS